MTHTERLSLSIAFCASVTQQVVRISDSLRELSDNLATPAVVADVPKSRIALLAARESLNIAARAVAAANAELALDMEDALSGPVTAKCSSKSDA